MKWLTWLEADLAADAIARWVREENFPILQIYGIDRGGLPLAVMVAHRLGDLQVIRNIAEGTEETLIVADIVWTGQTALRLYQDLPRHRGEPKLACWVLRQGAKFIPDFKVLDLDSDQVIKFPWETEETAFANSTKSRGV